MSMAIGHFAVGTSGTIVMFHMLPLHIRIKMRIAQVFIVISGGLWAMLPDIAQYGNLLHYFNDNYWMKISRFLQIRVPDLTVFINRIQAFHDSHWANICFFHKLMDTVDKGDSPLISGVLVLTMILIAIYIFMKELQEQRSVKEK